MPNHLARETSPYLLQHQHNPVDWYPWGPEALTRARSEEKPIFLSIGYAACHWCHVMEHESFEDPGLAALLNRDFVCIKVDREERPDLDQIYMHAVQIMTGHGGWPMSVFLTPELKPFFGGTYWPPHARQGMPGFAQVLTAVSAAWQDRRDELRQQAEQLTEHLQTIDVPRPAGPAVDARLLSEATVRLQRDFDSIHGGFGQQPKFPHPMALQFLLRQWRRTGQPALLDMVTLTLDRMAHGGIYDHLAGGFARYSVDERWLVPHFEKMLYDNALLAGAYLDGYLATGDERWATVVRETLDYVLAYMTDDRGGFHSTEDADSEGEEGKFYVWTPAEIRAVLGAEAGERFCYVYDVSDAGNFEGLNILNLPKTIEQCCKLKGWNREQLTAELADGRRRLLAVRDHRVRPGKDDKVLLSWNALMIDSLARAAAVFEQPRYRDAAARAADFILCNLARPDGRLLHVWRRGQAKLDAYLDDYAFFIQALVTLYETDFEERWIAAAVRLADLMLTRFGDRESAGLFYTADDHEPLIARHKDFYESSVPSGNALAATGLQRLGSLCGRADYLAAAQRILESATDILARVPSAMGQMLVAADLNVGPLREVVIIGDPHAPETQAVLRRLRHQFRPHHLIACLLPEADAATSPLAPLFAGKKPLGPGPTVYVCENGTCQAPVHGNDLLGESS